MKHSLQYTHQTGACGTNDCKIGASPQKCPSGHSGPFHHILIALPEGGAEWWFQCQAIDEECKDCSCWCDHRFPGPAVAELLTILVSPEMYAELDKRFPEGSTVADHLHN